MLPVSVALWRLTFEYVFVCRLVLSDSGMLVHLLADHHFHLVEGGNLSGHYHDLCHRFRSSTVIHVVQAG